MNLRESIYYRRYTTELTHKLIHIAGGNMVIEDLLDVIKELDEESLLEHERLKSWQADLDDRDSDLDDRGRTMDEREEALNERKKELDEREKELELDAHATAKDDNIKYKPIQVKKPVDLPKVEDGSMEDKYVNAMRKYGKPIYVHGNTLTTEPPHKDATPYGWVLSNS